MATQVKLVDTGQSVIAYVDGQCVGSANASQYTMTRRGRRVNWSVSVKFSERGGYGHTKSQAVSRLKRLIRDHYGRISYAPTQDSA